MTTDHDEIAEKLRNLADWVAGGRAYEPHEMATRLREIADRLDEIAEGAAPPSASG